MHGRKDPVDGPAATSGGRESLSFQVPEDGGGGDGGPVVTVQLHSHPTDAVRLLRGRRDELRRALRLHGALLVRGSGIGSADAFHELVDALALVGASDGACGPRGSGPRAAPGCGRCTPEEHASDRALPLHNALPQAAAPPRWLWLCSPTSGTEPGDTLVADGRKVLALLPAEVRHRFQRHGVLEVRNHHAQIDRSWQSVFGTDSREAVERHCRERGIGTEWVTHDHLRTRRPSRAAVRIPETGELAWFNQAHLVHHSCAGDESPAALRAMFGTENLPRNTYYGNGQDIPEADLAAIRSAYEQALHRVHRQAGDVLLLDNLVSAHALVGGPGDRGTLTAMTDPVDCTGAAFDGSAPDGTAPDGTAPDGTGPDGTGPDGTGSV